MFFKNVATRGQLMQLYFKRIYFTLLYYALKYCNIYKTFLETEIEINLNPKYYNYNFPFNTLKKM